LINHFIFFLIFILNLSTIFTGHTKHLQTIFLNEYTRLCDCPGIIFPTLNIPYQMQIICGMINIAQVRETFTTLAYVAARCPLVEIYNLHHPAQESNQPFDSSSKDIYSERIANSSNDNDNKSNSNMISNSSSSIHNKYYQSLNHYNSSNNDKYIWSGYNIAEAYAIKKGYYTKKLRLDVHRAGNEILRDIQSGQVVFIMYPPTG